VRIVRERGNQLVVRVGCDGCHRSAVSDSLTATELCRLIRWQYDLGVAYCLFCQLRRHRGPDLRPQPVAKHSSGPT